MDFAVKIYEPIFISTEEQIEGERRFFREAKMMFALNSPYIARIYDAGRVDNKPYIRMEYLKGVLYITKILFVCHGVDEVNSWNYCICNVF